MKIRQANIRRLGLIVFTMLLSLCMVSPVWSLTPVITAATHSNSFLFVENNLDDDYFITPMKSLDPRMTGSSSWTMSKWQSGSIVNKQRSLGYINSYTHYTIPNNRNVDIWFEQPPVNRAITGLRCLIDYAGCPPDSGVIPAALVDNDGFYKARTPSSGTRWNHGLISMAFYQFLRVLPTGDTFEMIINNCWTEEDYDVHNGGRCKDATRGSWYQQKVQHTKSAHLILKPTNSLSEVFIDSEGNPTIGEGGVECFKYRQSGGTASTRDGVVCKMLDLSLTMANGSSSSSIAFSLSAEGLSFTPNNAALRLSFDGNNWTNLNGDFSFSKLASSGSKALYIFFSNAFFKELAASGLNYMDSSQFLKINITNSLTPESGFYEFRPSNKILIKPRNFGISIISDAFAISPHKDGRVESGEPPLEFGYILTTSGRTEADKVSVQVTGPTGRVLNSDYCLLSARDNTFRVPFPGFLIFTRSDGAVERLAHNCTEKWFDITHALWSQIPWDDVSGDTGVMNKTRLKLQFPMDNSVSQRTTELEFWEGIVSASGEIRVSATWRNIE